MSIEKNNAILSEIRRLARELPSGQRDAIINKCNRVQLLHERYTKGPDAAADPEDESAAFENQRQVILKWLLDGNTITSKQAIEKFGITRLSAVIFQIEKATGVAPSRRNIIVPSRYGKNVHVTEYWIEQENNN